MTAPTPLEARVAEVLAAHQPLRRGDLVDVFGEVTICSCDLKFTGESRNVRADAHVAEMVIEALGVEERVEYGVRYGNGDMDEFSAEAAARRHVERLRRQAPTEYLAEVYEPMAVVSRTVSTLRIEGEWAEVEG